jgi:hypothetical protein
MSMTVLPHVVAGCLMLGLATRAAAECTSKSYKLSLPDRATLKLADGEHAIGSLQTEHGSLEARVTVKGKDISVPRFLIGGRSLREVSESALPQGLRDCLKNAPAVPTKPETSVSKVIRSALDWIVAPAQAATVSHTQTEDWYFTELCFKGTNSTQTCTYRVCVSNGFTGKTACTTLFVTGA